MLPGRWSRCGAEDVGAGAEEAAALLLALAIDPWPWGLFLSTRGVGKILDSASSSPPARRPACPGRTSSYMMKPPRTPSLSSASFETKEKDCFDPTIRSGAASTGTGARSDFQNPPGTTLLLLVSVAVRGRTRLMKYQARLPSGDVAEGWPCSRTSGWWR